MKNESLLWPDQARTETQIAEYGLRQIARENAKRNAITYLASVGFSKEELSKIRWGINAGIIHVSDEMQYFEPTRLSPKVAAERFIRECRFRKYLDKCKWIIPNASNLSKIQKELYDVYRSCEDFLKMMEPFMGISGDEVIELIKRQSHNDDALDTIINFVDKDCIHIGRYGFDTYDQTILDEIIEIVKRTAPDHCSALYSEPIQIPFDTIKEEVAYFYGFKKYGSSERTDLYEITDEVAKRCGVKNKSNNASINMSRLFIPEKNEDFYFFFIAAIEIIIELRKNPLLMGLTFDEMSLKMDKILIRRSMH